MDYAKKVYEIDFLYDIGLQQTEAKEVVAKLQRIKADFGANDQDWVDQIQNIVFSFRENPLQQEIKKNALAVYQICPICQRGCDKISLSRNRLAYYCKSHRVVLPISVEQ